MTDLTDTPDGVTYALEIPAQVCFLAQTTDYWFS